MNIDIPESVFTYSYDDCLPTGQIVIVNFRNREILGVVVGSAETEYSGRVKKISSILPYCIAKQYIDFIDFAARYTINSTGSFLRLLVPFSIEKILEMEREVGCVQGIKLKDLVLNIEQLDAVQKMGSIRGFRTVLLHGVTGSGKTEVFLEFLRDKKQILILVPEIALSNEIAKKVSSRISGIPTFIWHHSISPAKKRDIWKMAVNGSDMAIVGARSSLFIPFKHLNAIVVDEEHDGSYKQSDSKPIYNARDLGIYLGSLLNIPVVLSSATPSVESYNNAISGKYDYVPLKSRYGLGTELPNVYINDLKKEKYNGVLSEYSIKAIEQCLANCKQSLVYVNRRGHTPRVICTSCGWKVMCPSCSIWLCYHALGNSMVCHHCGYQTLRITKCRECGEERLVGIGAGVEKASSEIAQIFPDARIFCVSSDNMNTPTKISKAINMITNNEIDIIVGTQIMAKGHNFMNLNTIVITCVDSMLYGDDFRASEKAFHAIHQIAGRAGRSQESGGSTVIFQTFNPDDKLVQLLASNDSDKFYDIEIKNRKMTNMPPFGKMISVVVSSNSLKDCENFSTMMLKKATRTKNVKVMGPMIPAFPKLRNMHRLRFILLGSSNMQNYVQHWIQAIGKIPRNIRILIDVDPHDFI